MLRRLGILVALVATLAIAAPAAAITNGQPDNGEHPFVGQFLFYVPDAQDSRFDDPGAWFTCSGTLVSPTVVLTAGHCVYAVGDGGESTLDTDGAGGTDIWFNLSEAPDFSILPPSSTYARDENPDRYDDWSAALDADPNWLEAHGAFPHTSYNDNAFFLFDLGVVVLSQPVTGVTEFGEIAYEGYLEQFASQPRNDQRFTAVGYGLEKVLPFAAEGGDTRRQSTLMLVNLKSGFGVPAGTSAVFSNNNGKAHQGGTCFGDSGGPIFEEGTNLIVAVTSFGVSPNCTGTGGAYRVDTADDLEFLAEFGIDPIAAP